MAPVTSSPRLRLRPVCCPPQKNNNKAKQTSRPSAPYLPPRRSMCHHPCAVVGTRTLTTTTFTTHNKRDKKQMTVHHMRLPHCDWILEKTTRSSTLTRKPITLPITLQHCLPPRSNQKATQPIWLRSVTHNITSTMKILTKKKKTLLLIPPKYCSNSALSSDGTIYFSRAFQI